ncbi:MAG: NUDIX hydrolase [Chloroflexi bacterium]|nr:NUDIX hydrolase [Chloroflexota bacterium]
MSGGRREPGETVLQTLHREVLEETGWTMQDTAVLGFVHYHHLSPKPDGHCYPYPDFIQVIYTAVAHTYHPDALEEDEYVASSRFRPIVETIRLEIGPSQQILLATAVKQYEANK